MKRRTPNREASTPLRGDSSTSDPSETQEEYLAAFLCACVIGMVGVYCTRYQNSGAIKLRLYNDGENYEDLLNVNEEWGPLFDDYSKTVGVRHHYLALTRRIHAARAAERAAEASPATHEGEDTAPPAPNASQANTRALRGK